MSVQDIAYDYLRRTFPQEALEEWPSKTVAFERHITPNSFYVLLREKLNNYSYVILAEPKGMSYELMSPERRVFTLGDFNGLSSALRVLNLSPSLNLERASKAVHTLFNINNSVLSSEKVLGVKPENVNYSALLRFYGGWMRGTPAHNIGTALVSHSEHLPTNLGGDSDQFIDSYLRTLDRIIAGGIFSE